MFLLILLSLHHLPSLHLHRLQDVNLLGGPIPVTGSSTIHQIHVLHFFAIDLKKTLCFVLFRLSVAVDNSIRILETKRTESGSPGISLAVTVDGKSVMNAGKENTSSVSPELLHHLLAPGS